MKSFLTLQNDSDSGGSISPPSSDDSDDGEATPGKGKDTEFETLFPKSLEVQQSLQAKVWLICMVCCDWTVKTVLLTQVLEEVREFALYLGMNPEEDKDLLWIAVDAMTAKLPEHWEELKAENGQSYYYFKRTGQTQWEHPLDEYYRGLYAKLRKDKIARRLRGDPTAADRGDARRSCAPTAVAGRAMLPGTAALFPAAVPILDAAAAAAARSAEGRAAPPSDRQPRADGGALGPQVRRARRAAGCRDAVRGPARCGVLRWGNRPANGLRLAACGLRVVVR